MFVTKLYLYTYNNINMYVNTHKKIKMQSKILIVSIFIPLVKDKKLFTPGPLNCSLSTKVIYLNCSLSTKVIYLNCSLSTKVIYFNCSLSTKVINCSLSTKVINCSLSTKVINCSLFTKVIYLPVCILKAKPLHSLHHLISFSCRHKCSFLKDSSIRHTYLK